MYIRDYSKKDLKKYDELIKFIKENFHEEKILSDSQIYEYKYEDYDGDFHTWTTFITRPSNGYGNSHNPARIGVEKLGPDITKISSIEKLLLENHFNPEE